MKKLLLILCLSISLLGCDNFNRAKVEANSAFVIGNDLTCSILYSTDPSDVGGKFSILDLSGEQTRVLFEHKDFSGSSPLKKIMEDEDRAVLQLITPSGSVDVIRLNKKTGTFVRAALGGVLEEYVVADKGKCK